MGEQSTKDIRKDAPASHELTAREKKQLIQIAKVQKLRHSDITFFLAFLDELIEGQFEQQPDRGFPLIV